MYVIDSFPLHTHKEEEKEEEQDRGEKKNPKISLKGIPLKGSQLGSSHGSRVSDFLDHECLRNILMGWPLQQSTCTLIPRVHLLKSMHSPQFPTESKIINAVIVECTLRNISILRRKI